MFLVYIIKGRTGFQYVGLTQSLKKRLEQHHLGLSRVTAPYRPLVLIWYCAFPSITAAARFEKYLKSGSGRAFTKRHLLGSVDEVTA